MNNYEYIIASLPVIRPEDRTDIGADSVIDGIRECLDAGDADLFDFVLGYYLPEGPSREFYESAFKSGNAFVRDYFRFDVNVRNSKVNYLNGELGRPQGQDVLDLGDGEYDELDEVMQVLSGTDILERERGLDLIMWGKAEDLVRMHLFDMDVIISFVVRLKIIDRWLRLDPESGRAMFERLVEEISKSKKVF